jgi:hypothetical protein
MHLAADFPCGTLFSLFLGCYFFIFLHVLVSLSASYSVKRHFQSRLFSLYCKLINPPLKTFPFEMPSFNGSH